MRLHIEFPDGTYLEGETCEESPDLDGCFEFIDDEEGLFSVSGWLAVEIREIN